MADDVRKSAGDDTARRAKLDEELSRGGLDRLPPNQPKGLLGERGLNLYEYDDSDEPDLNAGVSQENDGPVIRMAIALSFLLFPPLGYVLLWRTRVFTRTQRWIVTAAGTAWLFVLLWVVLERR